MMVDRDSHTISMDRKPIVSQFHRLIKDFNRACNQENCTEVKTLLNTNNFEECADVNKQKLSDTKLRKTYKRNTLAKIFERAFDQCKNQNEIVGQLFFSAVKCDLINLEEAVKRIKNVNQLINSDTVLTFTLSYGNVRNDNFFKCIEILINSDADVKRFNYQGKTPIDIVAFLFEENKQDEQICDTLKQIAKLFLKKRIWKSTENITEHFLNSLKLKGNLDENFCEMNDEDKLFYYILKNNTEDFLKVKTISFLKNVNNGESTLLQLASHKSDKMLPIVQHLLRNGADPNKTAQLNQETPLELAARNNNQKIFEHLLKHDKTEVTSTMYDNFVRLRSKPMKPKLFEILLESKKVDPNWIFETTGNTPLHYAIFFSHKKAITTLLNRNASLICKNNLNKYPLNIMDSEDLERYFDSCLVLDNYTPFFSDVKYKMIFRFKCLIDDENKSEVRIISKIAKTPNLEHLLTHPLIHTFIFLKWHYMKFYFVLLLIMQLLFFLSFYYLFYVLPTVGVILKSICVLLTILHCLIKCPIFLFFKIDEPKTEFTFRKFFKNKKPNFFVLNHASLHSWLEIVLILTTFGSFFQNQIRALIFVEMSVILLITAGYHPKLSKWSLMLQQVFQTFTILLFFFSLIVAGFAVGFHILFTEDAFFKNVISAIFKTYVMTTGEFGMDKEIGFDSSGFGGYLLFFIFAMSMSLVIVNFWTGVAVTDIERIEKKSEINASKNVIIFMLFVDFIYRLRYYFCIKILQFLPSPFLFFEVKGDQVYKDVNNDKCEVIFFPNKPNQFEKKKNFPSKVDAECFDKICSHYQKLKTVSSEVEILVKLDRLEQILTEIKNSQKKDGSNQEANGKKQFKSKNK